MKELVIHRPSGDPIDTTVSKEGPALLQYLLSFWLVLFEDWEQLPASLRAELVQSS
jgi:hypothetical protein